MAIKTAQELKAEGYTVESNAERVRVYQHGEYVAALSPLLNGRLGFDWHRHDQWSLRSHDVEALLKESCQ